MKLALPQLALLLLAFQPSTLQAHRAEGLLQATLVEIQPDRVSVEVSLRLGIDIAPAIVRLIDPDGDGVVSDAESAAWAQRFLADQTVSVDGNRLALQNERVHTSPPDETGDGHGEIVIQFDAPLGTFARDRRTIVHVNRYEPIPSSYQCNGLVPKTPSIRIPSHRRDERQQELSLSTEFVSEPKPQVPPAPPWQNRLWLAGLTAVGLVAAAKVRI